MTIDLHINRETAVEQTPRVVQASGIFDLPPSKRSGQSWHHQFTLPDEWNIGVIVGPSGAGKTTLSREAFGDRMVAGWPWPQDQSILDGFPAAMGIKDITGLLNSVGFSSPPSWLRPFAVLSNGEQFRVNMARTLAEQPDLAVVDEFTSVVDRQVAQIGSAAVAKTVRRRGQKFVAVTCHYDVLDWLEPDWVYEPNTGRFTSRHAGADALRGLVRLDGDGCYARPPIRLEVARVHRSAWNLFKQHHYLSSDLHKGSKCFVGYVDGRPAAFVAVLSFPHPIAPAWREHRTVCLPDFQGVGIGNAMGEHVASLFHASGKRYISTTSHPAMIRHRMRSPLWKTLRKHGMTSGRHRGGRFDHMASSFGRFTAGFRYVGPPQVNHAVGFGLAVGKSTLNKPS